MNVRPVGKLVVRALDKTRERAKASIPTLASTPVPSECCSGPHTIPRVPGAEKSFLHDSCPERTPCVYFEMGLH